MKNLGLKDFNHKSFLKSFSHKEESQSDKWLILLGLFIFALIPLALLSEGKIIGTIIYLVYASLVCFIIHNNKTIINGGSKFTHLLKSLVVLVIIPLGITNFFLGGKISNSNQNLDSKKKFTNYWTYKNNPDVWVCEFTVDSAGVVYEYIGKDTGFCYDSSRGKKGRKVNPHTYYRGKFN
tara:strand:- start:42 stop:581 length:540 start_codon:yes stop_codon:yes gene_type:complete